MILSIFWFVLFLVVIWATLVFYFTSGMKDSDQLLVGVILGLILTACAYSWIFRSWWWFFYSIMPQDNEILMFLTAAILQCFAILSFYFIPPFLLSVGIVKIKKWRLIQ